jgi:hypothetical protein
VVPTGAFDLHDNRKPAAAVVVVVVSWGKDKVQRLAILTVAPSFLYNAPFQAHERVWPLSRFAEGEKAAGR